MASAGEMAQCDNCARLEIEAPALDAVLESVPDLVLIQDAQGRYLYVSPAITRYLDQDRAALIGHTWQELGFPATTMESVDAARARVLTTGQPLIEEFALDTPDGYRRFEYSLSPVRGAEGHTEAVIAIVRDITQRQLEQAERNLLLERVTLEGRRAEQAAAEASRRASELDAVIDALDDAVNVYSTDGTLVRANPASIAMFGFDSSGMKREALMERLRLRHPDGRLYTLAEIPSSRALKGEPVRRERVLFTDGNGREHIALVSMTPLRQDGRVTGAVSIWQDITDLEQAVADLDGERRRLQAVVQQMPAALLFTDASGKVVMMNDLARHILEISSETTTPEVSQLVRYPQRWLRPDGQPLHTEEHPVLRALLKGEVITGEEATLLRADGSQRILVVSARPIQDRKGRVLAAVATFADITEQRTAERERDAARQEALEAERERKRFYREVIRAITHDRFCLVEPTDIPSIGQLLVEMPLRSEEDYRALRGQIRTIAQQAGMDTTRAGDLVTAAAEAITNAIKHGTDPRAEIWVGEDSVVVRVSDRGPGIRPEDIPSVLFRHGFSTKVSLGMGYTIMLELADRLWLATSPAGTVLQLEKRVRPELEPEGFLPVAWEKL